MNRANVRISRSLLGLLGLAAACGGATAPNTTSTSAAGSVSADAPLASNPGVRPGDVTLLAADGTTWALHHAPDARATEQDDAKPGATSLEHLAPDGRSLGVFPFDEKLAPLGSVFTAVFQEGDTIYVASRAPGFRLVSWRGGELARVQGDAIRSVAFADAQGVLWREKPDTTTIVRSDVAGKELSSTTLPVRASTGSINSMAPRPAGGACVATSTGDVVALDASGAISFVAPIRERALSVIGIDDGCVAIVDQGFVRVGKPRSDVTVAKLTLPGLIVNATLEPAGPGEVRVQDGSYTATISLAGDRPAIVHVARTELGLYRGPRPAQPHFALVPEVPGAALRARTLVTQERAPGPLTASSDKKSALYADGFDALVTVGADGKQQRTALTGDKPANWTTAATPRASTVLDLGGAGWLAFDFETPVPTGTATHMSVFHLEGTKRKEVVGDASYYDVSLAALGSSVAIASYDHGRIGFVRPGEVEELALPAGVVGMRGFGDELVFATEGGVYRSHLGDAPETLADGYYLYGMDAPSRATIWASAPSALLALEDGKARLMTAPRNGNVAVRDTDDVWIGASDGIAHFDGKRWAAVPGAPDDVDSIVAVGGRIFYSTRIREGDVGAGSGTIGVIDEDVRDTLSSAAETSTQTIDSSSTAITPASTSGVTLSVATIPIAGGAALDRVCLARPLHGATDSGAAGAWVVDGKRAISLSSTKASSAGPGDCRDGLVPANLLDRVTDPWAFDLSPTGVAWFAMPGVAPIASRAPDGVITWFPAAPRSTLIAIDASRDDRIWFAGGIGQGELTRYDGTTFTTTFTPHKLYAVASFGDDVWAVGDHGSVVHARGDQPPTVVQIGPNHLRAVLALGANDVWVAGAGATLLHFDGTAWSRVPTPGIDASIQLQALFTWKGSLHVGSTSTLHRVDR